jgi:hypothetical protein
MNWKEILLMSLRILIGDVNKEKYSDESLENNLLVGSQFVCMDIQNKDYSISIPFNITPSPEENKDLLLLIALKTACLISGSEYKTLLNSGGGKRITMKDGVSEITVDNTGQLSASKIVSDSICLKYQDALFQIKTIESGNLGSAILGPYTDSAGGIYQIYDLIYNRGTF